MEKIYSIFLVVMSIIALIVFIVLFFKTAGYGKFSTKEWGYAINNKLGWILMESPVFIIMLFLFLSSHRYNNIALVIIFLIFQTHYFQRAFIFPFLLKGKSKMPISIMFMGALFNTLNGLMQGGWLFYISPSNQYNIDWLYSPQFIIGTIIFFLGMYTNIQSDSIIRNLRKSGDKNYYLPQKGIYKYVTSANYFGEIIEWIGFAILTWSCAGVVFAWWTFANLVPRANSIYKKYNSIFPNEMKNKKLKRIFPYIY